MAIIPIRKLPDPVLREQAQEITEINEELQRLIDDMAETMYAAPGLGLAATQVGVLQRLIVLDVAHREGAPGTQGNPQSVHHRGEGESWPGKRGACRWPIFPRKCGATPG